MAQKSLRNTNYVNVF